MFNLAKYYIFVTKCRERTLNFELFKRKISHTYNLEKNIAQRSSNKRLDLQNRKWHLLYNIVENSNTVTNTVTNTISVQLIRRFR